jgi:hypothetical protein
MAKKKGADGKVNLEHGTQARKTTIHSSPGPTGKVNSEGIAGRPVPRGGTTDKTTGKSAGTRKMRSTDAGARRSKGS